ncbi:MAG: zinc-ribbon domain-containing protein [Thermodesulfobacteriota bacterium]
MINRITRLPVRALRQWLSPGALNNWEKCGRNSHIPTIQLKEEFSVMKCSHCGQPLSGRICPSCGSEVLEESLFCHRCGVKLENYAPEVSSLEGESIDFSKRILCRDGTCIGVVNEKGVCKVCGKHYTEEKE